MPPAVLADSEDEEDGDSLLGDAHDAALLTTIHTGTNDSSFQASGGRASASTGSTDRLRKQIESAERSLLTNSDSTTRAPSISPLMPATKRRHTAAFGSQVDASPAKPSKRVSSVKTYGSSNDRRLNVSETRSLDQLEGGLEGGGGTGKSLRQDFIDHQPAVLFPESGRTMTDDSSTAQQQLLEESLAVERTRTRLADAGDEHKSSSFPLPTSEPDIVVDIEEEAVQTVTSLHQTTTQEAVLIEDDNGCLVPCGLAQMRDGVSAHSPTVEIRLERVTHPPKLSAERSKRDSHEDAELLNSEDAAIGLPKERYQPRPSRRRATHVVEEPVDYSIRPEKAARLRRTRTTLEGVTPGKDFKFSDRQSETDAEDTDAKCGRHSSHEQSPSESRHDATGTSNLGGDNASALPDKPITIIIDDDTEEAIFAKPSIPSPTKQRKAPSRSRRAHTTIFEDHMDFTGSQKSPSLSQQQEKRMSALQDVDNDASRSSRRGSRKPGVEGDDEDELPGEKGNDGPISEVSEWRTQDRGGALSSVTSESAKLPMEEGMNNSGDDEAFCDEMEKPPKKPGRGRPPSKNTAKRSPALAEELTKAKATSTRDSDASDTASTDATITKPPPLASATPALSPDELVQPNAATPQKTLKHSPTQHSPIKSSSKVPLRVGLSRRHRIPSLLRVMNPRR